jgi:hypothetical protein
MARKKPQQAEILAEDGKPIAASQDRDPELHALWLETVEAQDATKQAKEAEAKVKEAAGAALRARGIDHYKVDGADLWIEPGAAKVKAKRADGRPKGKIRKVTGGGPSEWGPDDDENEEA